jgi:hypothetical protein
MAGDLWRDLRRRRSPRALAAAMKGGNLYSLASVLVPVRLIPGLDGQLLQGREISLVGIR